MSADRIRVTHVLTQPELGGAQANTLYTLQHLDRSRFAPSLITSPEGPLAREMAAVEDAGVTFLPEMVRPIRPHLDWQAARALEALLLRERPHIVHTHSSKAGILGRWAARRAGVPAVIHTVHGFPFHDFMSSARRRLFVGLERAAARWTRRFVCVSRADVRKGVDNGIFAAHQAMIIRSGIRLSEFRAGAGTGVGLRAELEIPADAPLVSMVACMKPQKDPVAFIRLARRVLRRLPDAHFLLVGDGELRGAVLDAAVSAGVAPRLRLPGWRRDVAAVMDASDVVVLTSRHEGLPRVVPEAMASSRPVVATAVDGTPEAVEEGVTGFLFEPGDIDRAAARVHRLLARPDEARRMGEEACRRAGPFDIDAMVRTQEIMYEQVMRTDPGAQS